jgi:flagellar motor switch/type III secretory pathway protein FliN
VRHLAFEAPALVTDGRRVRRARFVERSLLPVAAACVVANGVRETLAALLSTAVELRLFAPVIPARDAWRRLLDGARLYRVRGSLGEAALILGPDDAVALAGLAFGETPSRGRPASPIEREVLARIVRALGGTLGALVGVCESPPVETEAQAAAYTTFFELALERPAPLRLGIATREPEPASAGGLRPVDLADVELELSAQLAPACLPPIRLGDLHPGAWLPITTLAGAFAELCVRNRPVARGACGARNGRYALQLNDAAQSMRGSA